jgi:hypothetical protein
MYKYCSYASILNITTLFYLGQDVTRHEVQATELPRLDEDQCDDLPGRDENQGKTIPI